jgi:hypothetical protein
MILDAAVPGKPVTFENGSLWAGFLVYLDGKDFALFSIQTDGTAIFNRLADKSEKHALKRTFYGDRAYRCVPTKSEKDECVLFFHR